MPRPGDFGHFTYRGWKVEWKMNMSHLIVWHASNEKKGWYMGDDEGGEVGHSRYDIRAQIEDFIDRAMEGRYLPSGIYLEK